MMQNGVESVQSTCEFRKAWATSCSISAFLSGRMRMRSPVICATRTPSLLRHGIEIFVALPSLVCVSAHHPLERGAQMAAAQSAAVSKRRLGELITSGVGSNLDDRHRRFIQSVNVTLALRI